MVFKLTRSINFSNEKQEDPVLEAFNELLKLTGGYFDGQKHIYQEVRPQDKQRVIELCQFILEKENFEEKGQVFNFAAAALEEKGEDIKTIAQLRKDDEFNISTGRYIKQFLEQVKSSK